MVFNLSFDLPPKLIRRDAHYNAFRHGNMYNVRRPPVGPVGRVQHFPTEGDMIFDHVYFLKVRNKSIALTVLYDVIRNLYSS